MVVKVGQTVHFGFLELEVDECGGCFRKYPQTAYVFL
jgi:hypothetical protein